MSDIIVITSGKGGVGKTTVTANLGASLARQGKNVVVIDADIGLRNLDVVLGLENSVVYDAMDVIEDMCPVSDALIPDGNVKGLYLLPAPQTRDIKSIEPDMLKKLCERLAVSFDYILLDCPAGIEKGFFNAAQAANQAIIVTEPFTAAVRDADRTVDMLNKAGIDHIRLIINKVQAEYIRMGMMMNVDKVLDILSVPLLGIIPFDKELLRCANDGKTVVASPGSPVCKVYENIAMRVLGHQVPIAEFKSKYGFVEKMRKVLKILVSDEEV